MHKDQITALDSWIAGNAISRPEAIRQLTMWALEQSGKVKPAPSNGAADLPVHH